MAHNRARTLIKARFPCGGSPMQQRTTRPLEKIRPRLYTGRRAGSPGVGLHSSRWFI